MTTTVLWSGFRWTFCFQIIVGPPASAYPWRRSWTWTATCWASWRRGLCRDTSQTHTAPCAPGCAGPPCCPGEWFWTGRWGNKEEAVSVGSSLSQSSNKHWCAPNLKRLLESSLAAWRYWAPVLSWDNFTAVRNRSGTATTWTNKNFNGRWLNVLLSAIRNCPMAQLTRY